MREIRESGKAVLLEHEGVCFWIQKRWRRKDGTLTASGKKALAMAAGEKRRHWDFDALRVFEKVRETEKAVLLRCRLELPRPGLPGARDWEEFWIPRSELGSYGFVRRKVKEIEARSLFIGTRVVW
jgi:hypothetical protein